jgi:hypothetical protein
MIYKEILVPGDTIKFWQDRADVFDNQLRAKSSLYLEFLRVNHMIHDEGNEIFYSGNSFEFKNDLHGPVAMEGAHSFEICLNFLKVVSRSPQ